ncbi:hypothetical protein MKY91_19635 [Alkalicoccobacillus gibsonii]|uniref:Uncharacterized protein n=1 Tax=Alkalicoccobacillus gibsonii TaxID=79881 RepID=A0ABU9VNA1_9BACI
MIRVVNAYYGHDAMIKREEGQKTIVDLNGAVFRLQNIDDKDITDTMCIFLEKKLYMMEWKIPFVEMCG